MEIVQKDVRIVISERKLKKKKQMNTTMDPTSILCLGAISEKRSNIALESSSDRAQKLARICRAE
jgi:hypothetical protein